MATVFLRTHIFRPPPSHLYTNSTNSTKQLATASVSLIPIQRCPNRSLILHTPHSSTKFYHRLLKLLPFASYGETTGIDEEVQESEIQVSRLPIVLHAGLLHSLAMNVKLEMMQPTCQEDVETDSDISVVLKGFIEQDNSDGAVAVEDNGNDGDNGIAKEPTLAIIALLKSYKEAIASNDESKVAEIESILKSIEDEKIELERKVAVLSEELSNEKSRILRISADFDNFRKRTQRERLSLVTNAQGEVVESLLPVLDNFERAKAQIKVETEGEEKINKSYQSIYKQFVEILESLGVVPVETIGKPFDPLASSRVGSKNSFAHLMNLIKRSVKLVQLHEAIMREESTEHDEDIIIEQYRMGFKLGDRLLRPSMVKVSAGPGPAKPKSVEPPEAAESGSETGDEGSTEAVSSED
ncbi:co-chaperone GrpE family protein [Actinidia rufa]|uniref:Co-chaperone GrpE family protein n=1 Tax=Actinidia rufa TaxID=165716 RepID=A0A7J0FIQ1_9ERIC|nr:co-chaperone GrpE family protein [Actinidia rufa]